MASAGEPAIVRLEAEVRLWRVFAEDFRFAGNAKSFIESGVRSTLIRANPDRILSPGVGRQQHSQRACFACVRARTLGINRLRLSSTENWRIVIPQGQPAVENNVAIEQRTHRIYRWDPADRRQLLIRPV